MLRCFSLKSSTTPSSSNPGPSTSLPTIPSVSYSNSTTSTHTEPSPTLSLTQEYHLAVQTNSYNEIWSKIHHHNPDDQTLLQPNSDSVHRALNQTKPTNLTRLISTYFTNSEQTSHLLSLLHRTLSKALQIYTPLHNLLDVIQLDTSLISQSQCDHAIKIFHDFHLQPNPFPNPTSQNFQLMRVCFSDLKHQLDTRLKRLRRRSNPITTTVLCLTGPLHALPPKFVRKQLHHIAQLDAAAKGAYVLNNDLDTIDRLVARLHGVVESDKMLVVIGLDRGGDRYPVQEVLKQLRKNRSGFMNQIKDLEEHVCLCFAQVNRARGLLLQEIHQLQNM